MKGDTNENDVVCLIVPQKQGDLSTVLLVWHDEYEASGLPQKPFAINTPLENVAREVAQLHGIAPAISAYLGYNWFNADSGAQGRAFMFLCSGKNPGYKQRQTAIEQKYMYGVTSGVPKCFFQDSFRVFSHQVKAGEFEALCLYQRNGLDSLWRTESRPWGSFRELIPRPARAKTLNIRNGERLSLQYHHNRDELWTVRSAAEITIGGTMRDVYIGEELFIPRGTQHTIHAKYGDAKIDEFWFGQDDENDCVRLLIIMVVLKKPIKVALSLRSGLRNQCEYFYERHNNRR